MALNLTQLNAEKETKVFALLAGKAGVGKTTQMTTFPREQTLIVSLEKGLLSIKGSGFAAEEITSYDRLIEILEKEVQANSWIKYVCIDSLSEIYDLINRELRDKFTSKQNFAKFEERQDKLFHAIRVAKQLPVTCLFICHTKEEKNGIVTEENLAFDGKLPEDLKKQFDLIINMTYMSDENGKKQRVFVTSPDLSPVAKRRVSPWLNIDVKDVEEPNLYKLTQKLMGK